MIKNPLALVLVLLLIESAVLFLSNHPKFQKYFRFLPHIFWIYFLPMIASTLGFIDATSAVYGIIILYGLPASLFLLLVSVDLKMILRLGRPALLMFAVGSFGIMLGTTVVYYFLRPVVGGEFAFGFAALSASWMGGSANMMAVKEALSVPDAVFLPLVIVDTVVPYLWMGLLVAGSSGQDAFDRWSRAGTGVLDDLTRRIETLKDKKIQALNVVSAVGLIGLGIFISVLLLKVIPYFPTFGGTIAPFAWAIIMASLLGLAGSMTPLRRLEQSGSNKIGYFILYFVLTTIGAKASIEHLSESMILLGAGFAIVIIHGIILILAARVLRVPVFLAAVASQANVGGVASAPIVAEIYRPGMAAVGLLMAVLGNIMGTYLGLIVGKVCSLFGM